MDSLLYDDKLAGEIDKVKYDQKHTQFSIQKTELETKRANLSSLASRDLERRLVILELSQNASKIYPTRTPEQKRIIISKLFSCLTLKEGRLSVKYSNFTRAIAHKAQLSRNLIGV